MSDNPLAQITEGLTKPVSDLGIALIEKLADAGYILYEPIHIKRIAKAQAKASKIQIESEIETTDLQQRTGHRLLKEETQHQKNMEDTTTKAIPQLNEDANPHAIDDDWIAKFFDKCRLVSDDKMQDLWAGILAGEANCAGSYSPKALTTFADMNRNVVMLFNSFCSLSIVYLEDPNAFLKSPSNFKIKDARMPIITGKITDVGTFQKREGQNIDEFARISKSIYQQYGFGINEFQLLSEHGLIQDDTLTDYSHFWYNNEIFGILCPSSNPPFKTEDSQKITISGYRLSSVGKELFHLTKPNNPPEYLERLIDFLQEYYNVKMHRFPKPQPSAQ